MRPHDKLNVNRSEIRRDIRRGKVSRCPVCGKTSSRHNLAVHIRAGIPVTPS